MKAKYILPAAIASLALVANVQGTQEYREHDVTVSYTLHTESSEQFKETGNGYKASQKIVTKKFSNKELLEALVDEGVISDIKGWSIKVLTRGLGEIEGIFLTRKNAASINITAYTEFDIFFALEEYKEQFNENKNGDEKYAKTSRILGTGYLDFFIGDFSTDTISLVKIQGKETYREKNGNVDEDSQITTKISFEKTVGEAYDGEEPYGVIEGSIKVGDGKKTVLTIGFQA
jgi:hypothetical protein